RPQSLRRPRRDVEAAIPVGFAAHDAPPPVEEEALAREVKALDAQFDALHPAVRDLRGKAQKQLGTLGGGNHFIELSLDTEQRVWLMLHSGSRNIGKTLAEVHMTEARRLAHNQSLPDRDLAVFLAGTEEMAAYRRDLFWAQRYAMANRRLMFALYTQVLRRPFPPLALEP